MQISLPPTMRMTASDGTEYVALQMHFHWGGASLDISGSEHTIEGLRHAAEVLGGPLLVRFPQTLFLLEPPHRLCTEVMSCPPG